MARGDVAIQLHDDGSVASISWEDIQTLSGPAGAMAYTSTLAQEAADAGTRMNRDIINGDPVGTTTRGIYDSEGNEVLS